MRRGPGLSTRRRAVAPIITRLAGQNATLSGVDGNQGEERETTSMARPTAAAPA